MSQPDAGHARGPYALLRYLAAVAVVGALAWATIALATGPANDDAPDRTGSDRAQPAQAGGHNENIPAPIREALQRGEAAIISLERVEADLQRRLDELQALRAEHSKAELEPAVARTRKLEQRTAAELAHVREALHALRGRTAALRIQARYGDIERADYDESLARVLAGVAELLDAHQQGH